jgi:hypothetical protein
MMGRPFIIDQVSWHTTTPGDPEPLEHAVRRFFSLVSFLQKNGLTTRELAQDESDIGSDFVIRTDDLTEEGNAVVKKAYSRGGWLDRVDHGMDPANVTSLERSLKRIREDA